MNERINELEESGGGGTIFKEWGVSYYSYTNNNRILIKEAINQFNCNSYWNDKQFTIPSVTLNGTNGKCKRFKIALNLTCINYYSNSTGYFNGNTAGEMTCLFNYKGNEYESSTAYRFADNENTYMAGSTTIAQCIIPDISTVSNVFVTDPIIITGIGSGSLKLRDQTYSSSIYANMYFTYTISVDLYN